MTCQYCDLTAGEKLFENEDETAEIVYITNFREHVICINDRIDISINYCPICGNRLEVPKELKT